MEYREHASGSGEGGEGRMGLREAAQLFNVPVETLQRRVNGTVSVDCRSGPHTVLTSEEESKLEQYVVDMSDMGFGLMKEDVMRTAFCHCCSVWETTPFLEWSSRAFVVQCI